MRKCFYLLTLVVYVMFSCKPDSEKPTVSTLSVTEVGATTAKVGGNVSADGGSDVTARGVCYGTAQNPTLSDNVTKNGVDVGSFTSNLTDLTPNTTYYVRAYAANSEGAAYGNELTFCTLQDGEQEELSLPAVVTLSVAEITEVTAVVTGEVVSDGGSEVTARGVCYATTQNPTIENEFTTEETGVGLFASTLTNLMSFTTYYVRAYATNSEGTAYGEEISFTTLEDKTINGYEYVDLGLPSGLKWAAHNVDALSPTEIGNFFAWGELNAKMEYTEANCLTYNVHIEDISGNPEYDVATARWGASWRMPTREEMEELREYCTWEWTKLDGMTGFKVIGTNDSYIFLPAVGFVFGVEQYYPEQYGYYWTSSVGTDNDMGSFCLYFGADGSGTGWYLRYAGLPIRPVSD